MNSSSAKSFASLPSRCLSWRLDLIEQTPLSLEPKSNIWRATSASFWVRWSTQRRTINRRSNSTNKHCITMLKITRRYFVWQKSSSSREISRERNLTWLRFCPKTNSRTVMRPFGFSLRSRRVKVGMSRTLTSISSASLNWTRETSTPTLKLLASSSN